MRQRRISRLDLATGTVTIRTEQVPGDASMSQRFAELRAAIPADPDAIRFAAVACNGCPARAEVDYDDPQLPDGWAATPAGEFCPACVAGGRASG